MTNKPKTIKNLSKFEDWTSIDIIKKLGVQKLKEPSPILEKLLNLSGEISPIWSAPIEIQRLSIADNYSFWNETELMNKFISLVMLSISFDHLYYRLYHERWLEAKVKEYLVHGFTDGMLAAGGENPEQPYFFFHEYKKIKGTNADPEGQVLISMIAASELNVKKMPIYGCYVIGKYWCFLVYHENSYSVSTGFDCSNKEELTQIWLILDHINKIVAQKVSEEYNIPIDKL